MNSVGLQKDHRVDGMGWGRGFTPSTRSWSFCGRLRKAPSDTRPFSLFFAVTRVDEDDDSKCALKMDYVKIKAAVTMTAPFGAKVISSDVEPPEVPIMYNPKKVEKGRRLTVRPDLMLIEVEKEGTKKRGASLLEASSSKAAAKKAKAEAADAGDKSEDAD